VRSKRSHPSRKRLFEFTNGGDGGNEQRNSELCQSVRKAQIIETVSTGVRIENGTHCHPAKTWRLPIVQLKEANSQLRESEDRCRSLEAMNESELLRTRELSTSCEDMKRELAKAQDSLNEEHQLVEQMQLRIDYLDESRRRKVRELHQKLKDCEVLIQKSKQSQLEYEN
jgi:hypothetical protein